MRLFGKKQYTCASCGAKFDSQNELDEHGKAHAAPTSASA